MHFSPCRCRHMGGHTRLPRTAAIAGRFGIRVERRPHRTHAVRAP
ncbi:hypothetical protein CU044_1748 [Streptomyces sp. L-9-10]|nr:hypothetical protein CU044_1748 [Streptomyces sp. L-9-10]